jgi:hypothetical protein
MWRSKAYALVSLLSGEKYTAEKIEDDPTGCEVEWGV